MTSKTNPLSAELAAMHLKLAKLEQKSASLEAQLLASKQTEQSLRQRETELADFVENAVEGLHRVGPDGIILWANKAELNMLGYRWEEYVGRHIAEFHVDAPVIECILTTLTEGGALYDQPARLRCKDGSIKHVLIHSNGCFENGKLRYTRCFTRDATERKELERAHAERAGRCWLISPRPTASRTSFWPCSAMNCATLCLPLSRRWN